MFVDRTTGESKMSLREAMGYFTQLRQLYGVKLAGGTSRPTYLRGTALSHQPSAFSLA